MQRSPDNDHQVQDPLGGGTRCRLGPEGRTAFVAQLPSGASASPEPRLALDLLVDSSFGVAKGEHRRSLLAVVLVLGLRTKHAQMVRSKIFEQGSQLL